MQTASKQTASDILFPLDSSLLRDLFNKYRFLGQTPSRPSLDGWCPGVVRSVPVCHRMTKSDGMLCLLLQHTLSLSLSDPAAATAVSIPMKIPRCRHPVLVGHINLGAFRPPATSTPWWMVLGHTSMVTSPQGHFRDRVSLPFFSLSHFLLVFLGGISLFTHFSASLILAWSWRAEKWSISPLVRWSDDATNTVTWPGMCRSRCVNLFLISFSL